MVAASEEYARYVALLRKSQRNPSIANLPNIVRHSKNLRKLLFIPILAIKRFKKVINAGSERIIDQFSQNIQGHVTFRVPEFNGVFQINPKSDLFRRLMREGMYEPHIARIFDIFIDPACDVVDIGANIGFFTVLAATRLKTGRVLAIEPTAAAYRNLTHNIELNGVGERVIAVRKAVSDVSGTVALNVIPSREEYSSIGSLVHPAARNVESEVEEIESTTLDELVRAYGLNPSLIKIDVEGAEGLVFAGSVETIRRHRPIVISELSNPLLKNLGSTSLAIVNWFLDQDYWVGDPTDHAISPGIELYGEILCIPREKLFRGI